MEKTNLEILDFEDKKSEGGRRYTRFKTSQGWMSAFDKETIEKLKECEGKSASVTIAVDEEKGFKNIRKFHGVAEATAKKPDEEVTEIKVEKIVTENKKNPQATMWESYAKDIFIASLNNSKEILNEESAKRIMSHVIEIVKLAKKEFEQ
jgi:hypothetical protein